MATFVNSLNNFNIPPPSPRFTDAMIGYYDDISKLHAYYIGLMQTYQGVQFGTAQISHKLPVKMIMLMVERIRDHIILSHNINNKADYKKYKRSDENISDLIEELDIIFYDINLRNNIIPLGGYVMTHDLPDFNDIYNDGSITCGYYKVKTKRQRNKINKRNKRNKTNKTITKSIVNFM